MDDDEIDDYIDPVVEAKKLKKKKKDELFVIFDYITFGSFSISLWFSFCAIFYWELEPVHYNLFLILLWFYVWVVIWIDRNLVRSCFNLKKFIKCVFRKIVDIIYFIKEVKLQIEIIKEVSQLLDRKVRKKWDKFKQYIYFAFIDHFKLFKKERRKRKLQIIKKLNASKLKEGFKNRIQSKQKLQSFIKKFFLISSEKKKI